MSDVQEPVVADDKPMAVNLEKGREYYWCACGKSANQPFCDGSHVDTPFVPQALTAEKDGDAYLCMCKKTGNAPFCDGSHQS